MDIGTLSGYAQIRFKIGYLNNTTFTSLNVTDISGISSEIINTGAQAPLIMIYQQIIMLLDDQQAGYTVEIEFKKNN